jgi:replicative DNA helicase
VSVTEIAPRNDDFERTPPHDVAAEQCVLGGMLLSKDAISDVIEMIRPTDHYRPAHQLIHEAILDLYSRGEPADAITVANELTRRGEIARVGGGPYLHTLIASVPTAANAGYYARIVRERAILRRLVEAGTRIAQFGYAGDADADELVDRAQAEVYAVTERRTSEDYHALAEIMPGALDEIEAIGSRSGVLTGVPTGFGDLDALTNGLHPGQMIVVAARPAVGKALALDTPLPTPSGWTTMGEIHVGEYLIGATGEPTRVVAATEVMHDRPCYAVEFSDGEVIVADENHQWLTWNHGVVDHDKRLGAGICGLAPPQVVTTGEIARSLRREKALRRSNHAVALPASVDRPGAALTTGGAFRAGRKRPAYADRLHGDHERAQWRYIVSARAVPTRPVRCVQVDSQDHLYLAGRGMVPTHNSTLALDFARAASIKHDIATVLFSLEMGRNEITMRLLSAEARVPLQTMRTGQMNDDDWARLARRMSEVANAPLFIDDSPNMSLMEIRAKCRRLKQRHDLKFVIIDYLQLMSSPKRAENRQQEVSDLSRSLKLLAKELDVPVVALSQLNRGPEQRTDKRPLLSDLRESGCMTEDTTLLRADTGAPVTFGELLRDGCEGVLLWSLDEQHKLVPSPLTKVFASGTKDVYLLRLASGREVKASANHPFLTFSGWAPLADLRLGDRLAIARHVPVPVNTGLGWSEYRIGLLAHLIGDGCVVRKQPVRYTSNDEENLAFVETAAAAEFGVSPRRIAQGTRWHTYLPAPRRSTHGRGNPLQAWFRELGIEDLRSHQKRLPAAMYSASDAEICLFLRHLWATDGCAQRGHGKSAAKAYYASSSRELAYGVAHLLARLKIIARIRQVQRADNKPSYHVIVADPPSLRTFCERIGVHGRRDGMTRELAAMLPGRTTNANVDTIPVDAWNVVRAERIRAGLTERQFQAAIGTHYRGRTLYKRCPSRELLLRCADVLDSIRLREAARSDIYWDRVVGIEPLGPRPVYDATVKGTHNFIAEGVVAHNSIEQDSDVVILLHREDAYERESPRAGEADLIVAKHRNGPTATVTVAFQSHYSRFVDMAH